MYSIKNTPEQYILNINEIQTIQRLQKVFNDIFPYLKIEFYLSKNMLGNKKAGIKYKKETEKIKNIVTDFRTGKISFDDKTTVKELEKTFVDKFGLYIQVFRKSGIVWLVTTATDDWTLQQQNEEGKSLAQSLKIEKENIDDHDVY